MWFGFYRRASPCLQLIVSARGVSGVNGWLLCGGSAPPAAGDRSHWLAIPQQGAGRCPHPACDVILFARSEDHRRRSGSGLFESPVRPLARTVASWPLFNWLEEDFAGDHDAADGLSDLHSRQPSSSSAISIAVGGAAPALSGRVAVIDVQPGSAASAQPSTHCRTSRSSCWRPTVVDPEPAGSSVCNAFDFYAEGFLRRSSGCPAVSRCRPAGCGGGPPALPVTIGCVEFQRWARLTGVWLRGWPVKRSAIIFLHRACRQRVCVNGTGLDRLAEEWGCGRSRRLRFPISWTIRRAHWRGDAVTTSADPQ